jgi:hypothetical protein
MMLSAVVWTGGSTGNWDDPANWSSNTLPGPNDDVSIGSGVSVVHSDDDSDSIGSLTSSGPLSIEGGTLSIASASTVGTLTINDTTSPSTTLMVDGPLTVNGLLSLSGSTISGSGTITDNGGTFLHDGTLDGPTLINPAGQTATFAPGSESSILMEDGAEFDNIGSFLDQSDYGFVQGTGASSSFTNQGSLKVSMNGGASVFDVLFNMRGGTVDVQGTYLVLGGGGTETGAAFTVESGAGLDFEGSTPFALDSGTTFSGAGNLAAASPPLTLSGDSASFTGPTEVYFGDTLIVDGSLAGSEQTVKSGATLGGSGTVGAIVNDGTISPGDSATITGVLKADGNVTFESGSTFNIASNGISAGTGYDQLDATGTVSLGGAALTGTLGFTPTDGETFTIIKSTAPIVGTFSNLPEGGSIEIGGVAFTISYQNNEVTLTPAIAEQAPPNATTEAATGVTNTAATLSASVNPQGSATTVSFVYGTDPALKTGTTITTTQAIGGGTTAVPLTAALTGLLPGTTYYDEVQSTSNAGATDGLILSFTTPAASTAKSTTMTASNGSTTYTGSPQAYPASDVTIRGPDGQNESDGTLSFTYNGSATVPTNAGSYAVVATFTPVDSSDETTTAAAATWTISTMNSAVSVAVAPSSITAGQPITLTAIVTSTAAAGPTGAVTFSVDGTAVRQAVPLNLVNGQEQATLTLPGLAAGTHVFQALYSGGPDFSPSASTVVNMVVNTATGDGPQVVSVLRYGYHMMPTTVVLTFDQALDASTAQDVAAYRIIGPAGGVIYIKSAVYDPSSLTVTLHPSQRISIHHPYKLIVDGTPPHGVTNTHGVLLDGTDSGHADSDYRTSLTWRNLVLDPVPRGMSRWPKPRTGNENSTSALAKAVRHGAGLFAALRRSERD